MTYQTLIVTVTERIATVTINRPDKLNALNALCKQELAAFVANAAIDPSIGGIIITGAGEKAFVAGTDIGELKTLNEETAREFAASGQALFDSIQHLGKPVIAAVNGYALGGGCELALACHIRIASANARFGQPEVNLGVIPGYGGTQRLPRIVGSGIAAELILTGNPVGAEEALRIGLVNKVVPLQELLPTATSMLTTILEKGPVAVKLCLDAINATFDHSLADGLAKEARAFGAALATADAREGISAFLEKRKPGFRGA